MCKCAKKKSSAPISYAVWESIAPANGTFTLITASANIFLKTSYGNHKLHSGQTFNIPSDIALDLFSHQAPIVIG